MANSNGLEYINYRLKEAEEYINYGIKEGYFDEDMFIGMSDEDKIAFADEADARAEAEYDNYREAEVTGN
jgi:hypothetical protein